MKRDKIEDLYKKFESICFIENDLEYWSARELQELLGYAEWRNFLKVVDKAKVSCTNSGQENIDGYAQYGNT